MAIMPPASATQKHVGEEVLRTDPQANGRHQLGVAATKPAGNEQQHAEQRAQQAGRHVIGDVPGPSPASSASGKNASTMQREMRLGIFMVKRSIAAAKATAPGKTVRTATSSTTSRLTRAERRCGGRPPAGERPRSQAEPARSGPAPSD